jgi:hypothetical protein
MKILRNARGKQTKNTDSQTTPTQQARLNIIQKEGSLNCEALLIRTDGFSTRKHNPAFGLPLNVDACNDRNHKEKKKLKTFRERTN